MLADSCAFLVPGHDAGSPQDSEMLRDVLLCRLERLDKFLDS